MIEMPVPIWVVFIAGAAGGALICALYAGYRERGKKLDQVKRMMDLAGKKLKK